MQLSTRHTNIMLSLVACGLLAVCVLSVLRPMRFDNARREREALVCQRLGAIRQAQADYRTRHGHYAPSLDSLPLADSVKLVPYGAGKRFELAATVKQGKDGHPQPLMECGARYEDFLAGLDAHEVHSLVEDAVATGHFPGLKIGDLNTPNNNAGNWE